MPAPALPIDPDDQPIFEALSKAGVPTQEAYTAVQRIRDVAAANLIAQLLDRFDSQNAKIEAQAAGQNTRTDALKSEIASLRWMIGLGFTLLAVLITLLRFLD